MNLWFLLGVFAGMAIGYIIRHVQDTKTINEMKDVYEGLIRDLKAMNKAQSAQITRLSSTINEHQVRRADPQKEFLSMSDVMEYVEVEFPNSEVKR